MKRILFIFMFLMFARASFAQTDEEFLNNLASDSAFCASYFTLVESCLKNSNEIEVAKQYGDIANNMILASILFSNQETAQSRLEIYGQQIKQEVDNHCSNISRAISKYHQNCLELYQFLNQDVIK